MTPEEKGELKSSFKEVVDEGLKPINEKIGSIQTKHAEIDERLKKIEALPTKTFQTARASDVGKKVYGFKLSKMGTQPLPGLGGKCIRQVAAENPHMFEAFSQEGKLEDFGEFMLDFIQASKFQNPDARQKLYERQKANYAEGGATTGDTLVPIEYQWDMIQLARNRAFALQECTVLPMGTDTLTLPREATMVSVNWTAEAVAATDGEGTLDSVTLTAKKLTALATASNELLNDSAVDLVGLLTEQFSYAVNLELDNQVLAGTGSPVSGLMKGTAGTSVVLGTGSAGFSMVHADNFSNAISQLEEGYTGNAKWIFHRTLKHYLRILKDTTGNYIYQKPEGGNPGQIWEYPYIVSEKALTTGASTVAAIFGNLRYFYIGRRLGQMSLELDPYGKFAEYQTRFRIVTRWGLALARSAAFVSIKTSAT